MMRNKPSNGNLSTDDDGTGQSKGATGSQTLLRGLDVMEALADGPVTLAELSQQLGLTRSTVHRLATALVERRYLTLSPRIGYQFGPKLLELGFQAQRQTDLVQVARPHLEALAMATEDTVHLGIEDADRALYLDKIPGRRRVEISSRVGERQPLTSTGLGKALLLDYSRSRWQTLYDADHATSGHSVSAEQWFARMEDYARRGFAFDLEENEDRIRCVAAPIRGASGKIVGAISVSSAAQYMTDERMTAMIDDVKATTRAISIDLGWSDAKGS